MLRRSLVALCLLQAAPTVVIAHDHDPPLLESAARLFSAEFRKADEHLAYVRVTQPPPPPYAAQCPTRGYHSRAAYAPTQTRWVQVDLGEPQNIDQVVLIPAAGPAGLPGGEEPGYYFPLQLRIDLANRDDFSDSFTAGEHETDPRAQGRVVAIPTDGRKARYIRVTATRLAGRDGVYYFALGELLALSGNRNLAAERPVRAFDSLEHPPLWSVRYLVDGQSVIGPPLSPIQNPSHGYLSLPCPTTDAVKWVQIDLGSSYPLEEIRLVAARANENADRGGFGFPIRFKVEAADRPDFSAPQLLLDATSADYANPGDGVVVIPTPSVSARCIRVTATRLSRGTADFVFALAELQAYSHGQNVALGSEVTALDGVENGQWRRSLLVDGCASQYLLLEWPEWVAYQQRSAEWQAAHREALADWEAARGSAFAALIRWGVALLASALVAVAVVVWRLSMRRRREAESVREQIARDLHGEMGKNLDDIMLLAQSGDGGDLPEVGRMAGATAAAMRDLVWLTSGDSQTLAGLLAKLRENAAVQLNGLDYHLELRDPDSTEHIPATVKRHFFLAFKEILHNVARHAHAQHVAVRTYLDRGWLILEVQDDGRGFDPDLTSAGRGLTRVRERANALAGELEIHSCTARGTFARLIVWLGRETPKPRLLPGLTRCARVLGWNAA